MKTHLASLTIGLAALLTLGACSTDNVAVEPDYGMTQSNYSHEPAIATQASASASASIDTLQLDFTYFLDVEYVPCSPPRPMMSNPEEEKTDTPLQGEVRCLNAITAKGKGQGYDYAIGRALATIDLRYDLDSGTACGQTSLDFFHHGRLVLNFCGQASDTRDGLRIGNVEIAYGTGIFQNAFFKGSMILANSEELMDEESHEVMTGVSIAGTVENVTL